MKIKTLFAAILAAGLLFSGCRQDEDYVLPDLRVGTESLEFGQQSNEQTVDVTASREWLVRSKPDWVAIDPDHGPASSAPQRVTVTVLDNAGYDRSGDVVFSIGLSKAAVTVNQKGAKGAKSNGTGTLDDPYTVEGALAAVANLTWTSSTEYQATEVVYVKGIISRIAENGSFAQTGTFGNGNFYISDDGATGDKEFYCYRVLYLGNKKYTSGTDIKVGDEVVICGKLMNYRGNTPETVANEAYLYSLNGVTEGGGGGGGNTGTPKGTGTQADPYNAAAANAAVANLTWTSTSEYQTTDPVYVKGKISRIADKGTYTESGTYGNASFYISDDGATGGSEFYCFHVLYLGNQKYTSGTDIKVGDEVIVYGKLMNYRGNTPETANGAYLYSLNGTTQGGGGGGGNTGTPKGTGTQADPYNAAAANAAASTLTYTDKDNYQKSDNVYIKGKISRIAVDKNNVEQVFTAQFGNASFYISDDGSASNEFYVYRALFLGNAKWQEGNTQIKVGDEVIICGKLMNFNGKTPETVANESYIYSLNGVTEGGGGNGGGGGGGTSNGTGTLADPYNAAGAIAAASALAEGGKTATDVYVKGKICQVKYPFDATHKTATFFISDDGNASGAQFQCYSVKYLGNTDWAEGNKQVQVGDEVIVCGKLTNYQGTPETASKEAYIYSLNGVTEGGGGNGGGGGQTQISYSKVSSITAGGKYILVGVKEGKYYAATPIASDKTYGRLNGKEITVSSDKITADLAANEFTITAVNGGYEIAMPDGRKLAVDTEHDGTFQIGDSFDHTFTAELSGDLFKISHKSTGKTIYHGGGTYTNFSCSTTVPADGTLLQLYLKDN